MGEWAERSLRRYPTSLCAVSLYGGRAEPGLRPGPPAEPTLPAAGRRDPDPSAWPRARPLAHKHPASGLSPGQLSAWQAGGRRVRAGRGRRTSPTVKKPWFPAHTPEGGRVTRHQVPVTDTLTDHSGASAATASTPPGRCLDVTLQRPSPKENDTHLVTAGSRGQTGSLGGLVTLL